MRTCLIRTVRVTDEDCTVTERRTTYERLERRFKRKLDRRRNYAVVNGELCECGTWTDECSGCSHYDEGYRISDPSGCEECGYTGKVRNSMWVPVHTMEDLRSC